MIEIRIRLFALLKELVGREECGLSLSGDASCREALIHLKNQFRLPEGILESCMVAVNGVYTERNALLQAGDELAVLPPVSGG